jgi:uncharacterized membrane protein
MSGPADRNEDASNRKYKSPYTPRQPVPNVQGYGAVQEQRDAHTNAALRPDGDDAGESKLRTVVDSLKSHLHLHGHSKESSQEQLYSAQNRNVEPPDPASGNQQGEEPGDSLMQKPDTRIDQDDDKNTPENLESNINGLNAHEKRKQNKQTERGSHTREVTDPITHLPVIIHDFTADELNAAPESYSRATSILTTKSEKQLSKESEQSNMDRRRMQTLFPPPNFDAMQEEFTAVYQHAVLFGLGSLLFTLLAMVTVWQLGPFRSSSQGHGPWQTTWLKLLIQIMIMIAPVIGIGLGLIWAVREWLGHRVHNIWENQVWEAAGTHEEDNADSPTPESTQWLNSLLASVWSLINPDLFAGLADTLEDVMQASLPKLVRMVSVEDLGQGNEALRLLGIRWLPVGAAHKDVSVNGKIKSKKERESDREVPGGDEVDGNPALASDASSHKERNISHDHLAEEGEKEDVAEGLEAEEGNFVNMELAFSYRASSHGKSMKVRSQNAHLCLAFFLPGGIRLRKYSDVLRLRLY